MVIKEKPGRAICSVCGDEILSRIDMGKDDPPYWIHLKAWWHKHKPQPSQLYKIPWGLECDESPADAVLLDKE